ncbi:MAG: VWA domain-containing protein [Chlorobium sp.]|jgi:Ca-activated chloride channel family protein|uniref:VWA domain-containing protein n=1 Tax=Chlorobium sp. TaxID=1095 RepID=UPI0025C3B5E2|nr:VWA domain-containing protein [Chlorobium sp.]MCF8216560.1 VWA domain-containing protein [Chlorobium sp.]MCF8270887.1 VWA domain-containing protein [Chlorobium sp.]MCF8287179.1 VWA domain-containing protein [Chlorobium sp.]MCF8290836.1 VWA domain-containing protein [Chlorobium sp.]MCF8385471.1 VWA domain-containing protein [Chlorobium sp.]
MQEWFSHIPGIAFEEPGLLLLLPALLLSAWLLRRRDRQGQSAALLFPGVDRLRDEGFEAPLFARMVVRWLRWSGMTLVIIAMARPFLVFEESVAESRGIDVVLVLDISESMLQEDVGRISRLAAVKKVAREFIARRGNDRIGIVVFRGNGYTLCPLTLDHRIAGRLLDTVTPEAVRDEGTAVGSAILIAVNRLKASQSAGKVMILLTDGASNAGGIEPLTAAGIAAGQGITIHTVGAGTRKGGLSGLHETELRQIAGASGGRYFLADGMTSLSDSFREIDRLEKSRITSPVARRKSELFLCLLVPAVVMLLGEAVLANTRLVRIP